jgi:glycosyl transferase family 25
LAYFALVYAETVGIDGTPDEQGETVDGRAKSLAPALQSLAEAALRVLLPTRAYERLTRDNRLLTLSLPTTRIALGLQTRKLRRTAEPKGVQRLDDIVVINLAKRADRLAEVDAEMRRLKISNYSRFEAIEDEPGILGCTRSHAECMRRASDGSVGCVMICEDDIEFLVSRDELDVLIDAFLDDSGAEVACLAYHHVRPPRRYNRLFLRAPDPTLTTTCYLVKHSIAGDLADCFEEGAAALAQGGDRMVFGLDLMWARLQRSRIFLIPIKRGARQRDGYSDIEERFVTYGGL